MVDTVLDMEIWKDFDYRGVKYYVEIFKMTDSTFQAFASKLSSKNLKDFEEQDYPIGTGWDNTDKTRAVIQAIKDLNNLYS